jgi:hypothetical protein
MSWTRPALTVGQILAWADAHRRRTGRWPTAASGPVTDAPGETWRALNNALYFGRRGLRGGDSLPRLLVRHGRLRGLWAQAGPGAWTEADDELLRRLSPAEAARRMGRSLGAVYARRSRLGLARRPDERRRD